RFTTLLPKLSALPTLLLLFLGCKVIELTNPNSSALIPILTYTVVFEGIVCSQQIVCCAPPIPRIEVEVNKEYVPGLPSKAFDLSSTLASPPKFVGNNTL